MEEIKLLKKQLTATRIVAAVCAVTMAAVIVCAVMIVPSLTRTVSQLDAVTSQLAEADFEGMVGDVTNLIGDSQSAVTQAAEKIDSIDIEQLNKAIDDFSNVVGPLARLFG